MKPVKRLKRELAYQGSILKIYKDTVEINDLVTQYDFIHHNGAAAVVPVTKEGKILMVRQYRNALDRFTLEIPAGKVDSPKEPRIVCAARELEEETGYRCENLEFLIRIDPYVAFCNEQIDIFVARNLIKTHQDLDTDEDISVEEWKLEDLMELIYTAKIKDAKTIAALLAYKNWGKGKRTPGKCL